MLNVLIIEGRLCADPVLKTTASGKSVTTITLACERDRKDANGEKLTDFVDVVAWGGSAEFLCRYMRKGRMAVAKGRLQLRDWTDQDGNKHRVAEMLSESVYFADAKREPTAAEDVDQSAGNYSDLSDTDGELPY